jgi:hypothetical protein
MGHRTYLWLYLAIDHIETTLKESFWPGQEQIPLIPKDVDDAYEKILGRVSPKQETTVKKILQIIVGARRPLSVPEMAMALGVALQHARTAEEATASHSGLQAKIQRLCGLFVFIKDTKIYLIHQTAKDFLITKVNRSTSFKWYLDRSEMEIEMTRICVSYLLMADIVHGLKGNTQDLLQYSAENWPDHFRHVESRKTELDQDVYKLYNIDTMLFDLWFPIFWKAAMRYEMRPKMNALHLAAFNGHTDIVSLLTTNERYPIDQPDDMNTNALSWACLRGHTNIVQELLDKGADVNAQGGHYGNALQAASAGGHLDIVQVLLDKGADVNAQGGHYSNALQAASAGGHLDIVQILVKKGAVNKSKSIVILHKDAY